MDPIEKKPFFHYLPGSQAYSIATAGCNFTCKFCQNYTLSQSKPEDIRSVFMPPGSVASEAKASGAESLAFTYNEPTVFTEFARDCAAEGKKLGIRSVVISNGFINPEPLERLAGVIAAYKVDFKAFSKTFYREVTGGDREPVLATIAFLKKLTSGRTRPSYLPTSTRRTRFRNMADWLWGRSGPTSRCISPGSSRCTVSQPPGHPLDAEKARDILMGNGMRTCTWVTSGHPGESTTVRNAGKNGHPARYRVVRETMQISSGRVRFLRHADSRHLVIGRASMHGIGIFALIAILAASAGREASAQSTQEKRAMDIRPSTLDSQWYGASGPAELRAEVEHFLNRASDAVLPGEITGLVSPHAGYRYSGSWPGNAYRQSR